MVGANASGTDEVGIHLVGAERPAARLVRRFAEGNVAGDEALDALSLVGLDEPRFVEQPSSFASTLSRFLATPP